MTIHLTLRDRNAIICETDINSESTVGDLKAVITDFENSESLLDIVLIFRGSVLEDERTLASYDIKDGATVYVVEKRKKIRDAGFNNDKLPSNSVPTSPADSFSSFMESAFGNSIKKMIQNNPQAYTDMLRSNPIFNQIAERNPQLQHILNDSDMLKENLELFLNPENQNQTARTMDRMLDTVESMPGGFQALSKQINDLQEPLFDGIMNQFKNSSATKTNIDTKPPSKPSEDPIPFQNHQPNNPFSMFGFQNMLQPSFPMDWGMEMTMSRSIQDSTSSGNTIKSIPTEAATLINNGILKCLSKGLNVANLPGFKNLVDECKSSFNQSNSNGDFFKLYSSQLKTLNEMGFKDNEKNIQVLIECNGNVDQAIRCLLNPIYF